MQVNRSHGLGRQIKQFLSRPLGRLLAGVLVAVVLAAIIVPIAVTQRAEAEQQAAEQAALVRAKEEAAAEAAEELAEDQQQARDLIGTAEAFLATNLDYADPADVSGLTSALEELRARAGEDDPVVVSDARKSVATLIAKIGDRPEVYYWSLTCSDSSGYAHQYSNFRAVWAVDAAALKLSSCNAKARSGDYISADQQAAIDSGGVIDETRLGILDSICAALGFSTYGGLPSYSEAQILELGAAVNHCPDHPRAGDVRARLDASSAVVAAIANGTQFQGGVKRVGTDVQPGTYASEGKLDGCYWERQDSAGEIIDNNFVSSALRVEVRIAATDFAFSSSNCGTWKKVS
ncbi:hypothetical protein [Rathayibacter sp. PhB151]|uniref:hypothetical protein n=1 Tax=Rathayibacter sp. PhB151 TaxID=2485189 RepID=UPI00106386EE|nr:hypothetical protein [Rathayibacter sp. PhB151]